MDVSDALIATFYVDTAKYDTVKIRLGYETVSKEYCDILNYFIASSDPLYKTNAPSQIFVSNFPEGTKREHFLTGPAPEKPGETKDITLTMWTDIAQEDTITPTNYIHSGAKIIVRLVGI